ncbi:hypothetical protein [Sorangium sp. So ce1153]|uniref:hypothetical protein n=1 Tax=Sorangium sp. So ce1153 TaxID=3133333 RepID=UPI003F617621
MPIPIVAGLCSDYPLLFWLAFGPLALVLTRSGPVPPRPPSTTAPTRARTALSLPPPDRCQIAAELRKLVPTLLDKGRLDNPMVLGLRALCIPVPPFLVVLSFAQRGFT